MALPPRPRPPGFRKPGLNRNGVSFERAPAPTRHGYVKGFDGTKLFYSVEGEGQPLVFCYGLICSSLHWTYQIEAFKTRYQAIWFDYRGHQNSERPKDLSSLTLENIARDLGTVLDEVGVQEAVVLGHSMGVNVALDFYRQQPERVHAMVLANGTAQRPLETLFRNNLLEAAFKWLERAYRRSPEAVALIWKLQTRSPLSRTLVTLGGFNPHLTAQGDIDLYLEQVAETDPGILVQLIQSYNKYDATAWLNSVRCPTLVIAGQEDKVIPLEQQELMHQLLPRSELEVIRHGSHCPQMDLPELINGKIQSFLTRAQWEPQVTRSADANPPTGSANPASPPEDPQDV